MRGYRKGTISTRKKIGLVRGEDKASLRRRRRRPKSVKGKIMSWQRGGGKIRGKRAAESRVGGETH